MVGAGGQGDLLAVVAGQTNRPNRVVGRLQCSKPGPRVVLAAVIDAEDFVGQVELVGNSHQARKKFADGFLLVVHWYNYAQLDGGWG